MDGKEGMTKLWKHWLIDTGYSTTQVAENVGQSQQNLQKKIRNMSLRAAELIEILDAHGYELRIAKKEG